MDKISQKKKTRKRRMKWFSLPYCVSVKTNVGRVFLKLNFPKNFLKNILQKVTV